MADMEVSGKGVADAKQRGNSRVKFNSNEAGELKVSDAGAGFELGAVANDKFGERLARASTTEQGSKVAMPADPVPAWLMSAAPETGEIANSEDVMEEFLQDDDMLNLELICAKWRGLDEFEQEALSKICPEMRKELAFGDQHIQEFLEYRRKLNDQHALKKKMQVDWTMRSTSAIEDDQDDEEAMSEASEDEEAEENRKTIALNEAQAVQAAKQTGGRSARGSVLVKGAAAAAGVGSVAGSPHGGRRASMAAQPAAAGRLGRAGGAIAGQEDVKQTNPSTRQSSVAAGAKAKAV